MAQILKALNNQALYFFRMQDPEGYNAYMKQLKREEEDKRKKEGRAK